MLGPRLPSVPAHLGLWESPEAERSLDGTLLSNFWAVYLFKHLCTEAFAAQTRLVPLCHLTSLHNQLGTLVGPRAWLPPSSGVLLALPRWALRGNTRPP